MGMDFELTGKIQCPHCQTIFKLPDEYIFNAKNLDVNFDKRGHWRKSGSLYEDYQFLCCPTCNKRLLKFRISV